MFGLLLVHGVCDANHQVLLDWVRDREMGFTVGGQDVTILSRKLLDLSEMLKRDTLIHVLSHQESSGMCHLRVTGGATAAGA